MLLISELRTLCEEITTAIPAIDGGHLIVVDSENASNRLTAKAKTVLVASVPSAQALGQTSNLRNTSIVIMYILQKRNTKDEIDQLEALQPTIIALQTFIQSKAEEGCNLFNYLEIDSLDIDPVYNEFGGFNGWSLTMVF